MSAFVLLVAAEILCLGGFFARRNEAELHKAAFTGDVRGVFRYLKRAANLEESLYGARGLLDGATPLILAAHNGHREIVRLLLEAGADPDGVALNGIPALSFAAMQGHVEVIEILMRAGADATLVDSNGVAPIGWAAVCGELESLRTLLSRGAPLAQDGAIHPLHPAARSGHAEVVRALVDAGVDPNSPNAEGVAPLMLAAASGRVGVVDVLLAAGANARAMDPRGWTPLFHAAPLSDALAVWNRLLEDDLEWNLEYSTPQGFTLLMAKASHADEAAVGLLLNRGADPLRKDARGATALHHATPNVRDVLYAWIERDRPSKSSK